MNYIARTVFFLLMIVSFCAYAGQNTKKAGTDKYNKPAAKIKNNQSVPAAKTQESSMIKPLSIDKQVKKSSLFKGKRGPSNTPYAYGYVGNICAVIEDRIDGVTSAENPDNTEDRIHNYNLIESLNDSLAELTYPASISGEEIPVPWRLHHLSCSEGQLKTFTLFISAPQAVLDNLADYMGIYGATIGITRLSFTQFFLYESDRGARGELSIPDWPRGPSDIIPYLSTIPDENGRGMMFFPFSIEPPNRCGDGGRDESCENMTVSVDIPNISLHCAAVSPCDWGYGS